jgi:glucose-6-phosphate isomerase
MIRVEVEEAAKKHFSHNLKYVLVVGIGGANLGTDAIYHALKGNYIAHMNEFPKLLCMDTVAPKHVEQIMDIIMHSVHHHDEIVVNFVSKSGTTTETLLNATLIYHALKRKFAEIDQHIVVTTDAGSALHKLAEAQHWTMLPIPKSIGGRFSVLSPVGLFPLRLLGIDIDLLLQGAYDAAKDAVAEYQNSAFDTAEIVTSLMNSGVDEWNLFFFSPRFETLGKWSRQLIAESLGKEKDKTGKVVRKGITPIISIGSTDLHSMGQLYFGGPKNKFTTVVTFEENNKIHTLSDDMFLSCMGYAKSLTPKTAIQAITKGVFAAYDKHKLPYQQMKLQHGEEYDIGMYLMWLECTVYYISLILNIDAFDQPNVEDYKVVTKRELA